MTKTFMYLELFIQKTRQQDYKKDTNQYCFVNIPSKSLKKKINIYKNGSI